MTELPCILYVVSYKSMLTVDTLILLGPYYSFRTWQDMYSQRWSRWANCDKALIERGYILPVYVILFILSGRFFPLDIVKGRLLNHFKHNTFFEAKYLDE